MDDAMGVLVQSNDPIALKVVVGAMPVPKPELNADLYGNMRFRRSGRGYSKGNQWRNLNLMRWRRGIS